MKILLAIDGSSCSNAAVENIAQRLWPADTEVRIVSAVEPPLGVVSSPWNVSAQFCIKIQNDAIEQARNVVNEAEKRLNNKLVKFKISTLTPIGNPEQVILSEGKRWGADLIVLGSWGHGAANRFRLGSVSNGIVQNAECSVHVVRQVHLQADNRARQKISRNGSNCSQRQRLASAYAPCY
jgi:nucleotide-binding universal stress UspA family protein